MPIKAFAALIGMNHSHLEQVLHDQVQLSKMMRMRIKTGLAEAIKIAGSRENRGVSVSDTADARIWRI